MSTTDKPRIVIEHLCDSHGNKDDRGSHISLIVQPFEDHAAIRMLIRRSHAERLALDLLKLA